MKIGALTIDSPFVLAPLAGYTDSPMRRIARRFGASMVWTELVSAEGAVRDSEATLRLLEFEQEERPIAFQLFGARPEAMEGAARRVARLSPDVIDLNIGCPARKVVRGGSGAALATDPGLLSELAAAVVGAVDGPVTAKIRSGWDDRSVNAPEIAALLEECGVAALAVHPRTRARGFAGRADWSVIRRVREAVSVPVIGSGDVTGPAEALRMMEETSCDAVMIGRAAVGNPWIFERSVREWSGAGDPGPPPVRERLRVAVLHLDMMVASKGERTGVLEMRKHLVAYLKGIPGASKLRRELVTMEGHLNVRNRLSEEIRSRA
ncbi:MAG: tRNA dihydrouridine synthase DusB [Candidatus Eisenbacteria bacterium]|nr:tRNA dihydrouridine synthase DusB [Candidatus Eisenbacteria bacterium]